MTQREFLNAVAQGTMNEEIMVKAAELVARMNKALEDRKSKPSKKTLENEPIKQQLLGVLTAEPVGATQLGAAVGISTQKASALLRQLVAAGQVESVEVKGGSKGYKLA